MGAPSPPPPLLNFLDQTEACKAEAPNEDILFPEDEERQAKCSRVDPHLHEGLDPPLKLLLIVITLFYSLILSTSNVLALISKISF